jgi:hypothetical protein
MKLTQKHMAAISTAIQMYLDDQKALDSKSDNLISSWKHASLYPLPYSHNRAIGGWSGRPPTHK